MAKHICRLQIDDKLKAGDITLIADIRKGHRISKKKSSKEIDFYSFATKYSAFHAPKSFPMFDRYIKQFVTALNRKTRFFKKKFTHNELRNYTLYKEVIDALIEFTKLPDFRYKKFDQGLWIYAKYWYRRKDLTREEVHTINKVLELPL